MIQKGCTDSTDVLETLVCGPGSCYALHDQLSLTMYKLSSTAYCTPCGTLVSLSVVVRLPDLQRCTLQVNSLRSHNPNGGISIKERSAITAEARTSLNAEEKQQQADADYARQLQAKLDAQEARGGPRSASAVAVMSVCHVIAFVGTHLPGGALCV